MKKIPVAASAVGSHWYEAGMVLKRALVPFGLEVELDSHSTDHRNIFSIAEGKSVMAVTSPAFLDFAQQRRSLFKGADHLPDLRVIAALNCPHWLVPAVARSTGINSLAELISRRHPWKVVIPAPDHLLGEFIDAVLREHGTSREEIISWGGSTTVPNDPHARGQAMAAGQPYVMRPMTRDLAQSGAVDGFFVYMGWTSAWPRDMTTFLDLKCLPMDEGALDRVIADLGAQKLVLPTNTFRGVDQDMYALGWSYRVIYGTVDTPNDLVRTVLRALRSHKILENAHGFSYSAFEPPVLPKSVKLHPVTEDYFQKLAKTDPLA